jgi:aspartate/methionine/tyrosine aminotransferase
MFNRAAELPDVINLAVGQPDFDTPPHVLEAARRAAERGETKYTHGLGIPALREATAEKVRTRNHIPVEYGSMAITVGAMEGIILAMLTVLQPGDEVLIPDPGYTNFAGQVLLAGATPVSYGLEPPDYGIDEATLRTHISDRTRAILLCSPSNPTGAVLDRASIETVARIAQEHNLLVFSDETYEDLIYEGEHVSIGSLPGMAERTVSIFSFSKTFAMTGWRVGYVAAPPEVITTMNALQEHVVSCASSVSQHAALAALTGPQDCVIEMRTTYDRRRRRLVDALNAVDGFSCPLPRGAFYVFPDISAIDASADTFADWVLDEARVAIVPGTAFNTRGEGHVRISYAASQEALDGCLERIKAALARR